MNRKDMLRVVNKEITEHKSYLTEFRYHCKQSVVIAIREHGLKAMIAEHALTFCEEVKKMLHCKSTQNYTVIQHIQRRRIWISDELTGAGLRLAGLPPWQKDEAYGISLRCEHAMIIRLLEINENSTKEDCDGPEGL